MNIKIPSKHLQIEKANSRIMAVVAVASVVTIFSLMSAKTMVSQINHQRHVLSARSDAVKQLKKNNEVAANLETYFDAFNSANPNMIGGIANNASTGPADGDNARITLDALPSVYDYPALVTSLEKILKDEQLTGITITGTDQSDSLSSEPTAQPSPAKIEITISGTGNYASIQNVIKDLERSIRPFDMVVLELQGDEAKLQMTAKVITYYQPAKSLETGTKEVK